VQVVPDLGAHEEVLALHAGLFFEEVADGVTDLALVLVEPGAVEVTVAGLQRCESCGVGLAGVALAGEGAEAHGGDGLAIVKSVGLSVRHVGGICL
jgi:hypothetical protein